MKRKEPILNNDKVIVHMHKLIVDADGKTALSKEATLENYKFGQLKTDFLNKTLDKREVGVSKVYLPRTNKTYHVTYLPTKGFRFQELL